MLTTTWPRTLAWRLGRQLLEPRGGASAVDVVRRLGAVLSSDAARADLTVRARSTSTAPGDLARAQGAGEVVEVFAYRGALHLMVPEQVGTWLALRAAGRQWELRSWVEHYRLTPEDWPDFRAAVREALAGGPLTVPELGERLAADRAYRHLRDVFADGAGTLIKPLCWQGDVCTGRRDGRLALQRLDQNPRWTGLPDLDEAGPAAVRHHLRSYGPLTRAHVHHWLGAGLSAGRRRIDGWLDGLADELVEVDVQGTTAYVAAQDADDLAAARGTDAVHLLPGHDPWVMGVGTQDEAVVPPALREAVTRKADLVLAGGVVRGTWTRRTDGLEVTGDVPRTAVEAEAARLEP